MKKILPIFLMLLYCSAASAQITTAVVKANFGVEADLSSNFFNNITQPAVDDWFGNGYAGTGKGIIDTTGAAAIVAGYISNPASRKLAFEKRMGYPAYSVVNNRILLDAVFYRDYHGKDSTVFAIGSNKNGFSPANWTSPGAQSIPDKNDILEAMIHVRRAGPSVTDSLWLFSGLSIENVTGNRFFDFELYQSDISFDKATGTFSGYGPDAGHTSFQFDAAGKITKPGDIIFTAEFSSSSLTLVEARIWVKKSMLLTTPASFIWGGQFDGDGAGATYGYANIRPKTAGNFYTGLQSTVAATSAGAFKVVRDDESVVTTYIPRQFMEFSVNLTKLGIEPTNFTANPCGSAFIRVLVKTRSSTSFTAELKDFVAPFKFFNYPKVEANTYLTYFCGSMPNVVLNVTNANPSSVYLWTSPTGNITGSNTGPSITVNAPGVYYVHQQLNAQCPSYSTDSITILYAPVCAVLDVNITKLQAAVSGADNVIKWQAGNNELAARYEIEYSTNNRSFMPLGNIDPAGITGEAGYEFRHPSNLIADAVIYYRIRVVGKNGITKFSNTAVIRKANSGKKDALVFPNPTNGLLWLSFKSAKKEIAEVMIMDNYGNRIIAAALPLNAGENLVKLPELFGKAQGTYLVRIKTSTGFITQKIILKN